MPTYEYECKTCGRTFDHVQPITAAPLRSAFCEHCARRRPVRRLLGSGAALLFRGSGFYQTDYRSESYRKAAEKESKPAGSAHADGDKKTAATTKPTPADDKPAKRKPASNE